MSTLKTNTVENIAGTATAIIDPIALHTFSADGSITFTGIPSGSSEWMIEVAANGVTITWPSSVEWDGDGVEPEWTTGIDTVYFYTRDGGTTIKGMMVRGGA